MVANPRRHEGHIVLLGAMGAGKSSVGRLIGDALGLQFVDNDELLSRRTGRSAAEIARVDGAVALHRHEAEAALAALADPRPTVVAVAASAIEDARVTAELSRARVVWLRARPETLRVRLPASGEHRPSDASLGTTLEARDLARSVVMETLADHVVDVDGLDPRQAAERVLGALSRQGGSGARRSAPGAPGN